MTTPTEPSVSVLVIKPENYGNRTAEVTTAYVPRPGETVTDLADRLLHEPITDWGPQRHALFDARIEIRLAHVARSAR